MEFTATLTAAEISPMPPLKFTTLPVPPAEIVEDPEDVMLIGPGRRAVLKKMLPLVVLIVPPPLNVTPSAFPLPVPCIVRELDAALLMLLIVPLPFRVSCGVNIVAGPLLVLTW